MLPWGYMISSIIGHSTVSQEDPSTFSCRGNSNVKITWPFKTTEALENYYIILIEPYAHTFFVLVVLWCRVHTFLSYLHFLYWVLPGKVFYGKCWQTKTDCKINKGEIVENINSRLFAKNIGNIYLDWISSIHWVQTFDDMKVTFARQKSFPYGISLGFIFWLTTAKSESTVWGVVPVLLKKK